jgi:hypothetical protein
LGSRAHRDELAIWLFTLALAAPCVDAAAQSAAEPAATAPPKQWQLDEELGEVLVEGKRTKPKSSSWDVYQTPFNWMARMVGTFVIDGDVDLHALGRPEDLRKVSGRAECIGFGVAPGVQCELKIRWPETQGPDGEEIMGGVSTLDHAVMLFGSDPTEPSVFQPNFPGLPLPRRPATPDQLERDREPEQTGVSWILVDGKGVAESAVGKMVSADTMQSRSSCVGVAGDCERVFRITAWPDMKVVEFRIIVVIDADEAVNYTFVMHRVPGIDSVVYGRRK